MSAAQSRTQEMINPWGHCTDDQYVGTLSWEINLMGPHDSVPTTVSCVCSEMAPRTLEFARQVWINPV